MKTISRAWRGLTIVSMLAALGLGCDDGSDEAGTDGGAGGSRFRPSVGDAGGGSSPDGGDAPGDSGGGDVGGGAGGGSTGGGSAGGADAGGSDAPFDIGEISAGIAESICEVMTRCMGSEFMDIQFSGADCVTFMAATLVDSDFAHLEDAIADGRVIFHPEGVQACVDAFAAVECAEFMDGAPPECAAVFEGTVADGEACDLDEECGWGSFCELSDGQCPGQCATQRTAGSPCSAEDECGSGLTCIESGQCRPPAMVGEPCGAGAASNCVMGTLCVGVAYDVEPPTPGSCRAVDEIFAGAEDEACDVQALELCDAGLSCGLTAFSQDGATWACVEGSASGSPCWAGLPDPCPATETCHVPNLDAGDVNGTCVALPGVGQPCAEMIVSMQRCEPGLICNDADMCAALARLGEPCLGDEICFSQNCADGACAVPDPCAD